MDVSSDDGEQSMSFFEEDDDDEQAAVDAAHIGVMCKINRFTVLTAMIMWMVGKTRHANLQLGKANAFLAAMKERKPKDITARDRECMQTCDCKYFINNQPVYTIFLLVIVSSVYVHRI